MTLNPNPELGVRAAAAPRLIYRKPDVLLDRSTHYCPGCGHGVVHRLLAEVMTELDLPAHTIAVAPVGCAVFAYDYLNVDFVEAPHGRAPAVATGIRRVRPEAFVLTYQGDATWPPSARRRSSMPRLAASASPPSSSTTASTA